MKIYEAHVHCRCHFTSNEEEGTWVLSTLT